MTAELLTRRDLAARLAVHMQTVTKWERDGLPIAERGRKGKPSRYEVAAVREWIATREKDAKAGGAGVDVARERARKERAQAELAEQLHATRARHLLPTDEVERVVGAKVAAARTVALTWKTSLVDRLELAYQGGGRAAMVAVLDEEVDLFLLELAGGGDRIAATARKRKEQVA